MNLFGIRIFDLSLAAQTKMKQRRKHRKTRINKKWAKRYGYIRVPDPVWAKKMIRMGDDIYCGSIAKEQLIAALKQKGILFEVRRDEGANPR